MHYPGGCADDINVMVYADGNGRDDLPHRPFACLVVQRREASEA